VESRAQAQPGVERHAPPFRFEIGQPVQVVTHPARPQGTVVARWPGRALDDPYGENCYQLSSFVTKQRESSLAPGEGPRTEPAPE
jgi:hypothetical protein